MTFSEKRIAEGVLVLKNILSGLFPVLTVIAYANDLPPLTTLAWSSLIATIFFIVLVTVKKEWKDNIMNTKALKDILLSIFFIAVIYHFLFFLSLEFTSPQNVSLLGTMEIVFGFIILGLILKKEPVSRNHVIGAMLMFVSAAMILFQNKTSFNIGDLIILVAVAIAPIGNIFSKRALHQVSLSYLLFMRSLGATIVFFAAAYIFEDIITMDILMTSIPYLLFSGLVFLGAMKVVTMFGFHKTSVTHTISFSAIKPISAFLFAWLLINQAPSLTQLLALVPALLGLYILATAKQKATQYGVEK